MHSLGHFPSSEPATRPEPSTTEQIIEAGDRAIGMALQRMGKQLAQFDIAQHAVMGDAYAMGDRINASYEHDTYTEQQINVIVASYLMTIRKYARQNIGRLGSIELAKIANSY